MKKIQSSVNPRIKNAKKVLAGKNATDCVIEGKRLFKEAVDSGMEITEVFVTQAAMNDVLVKGSKEVEVFVIPDSLMAEISTVDTPPGILAVAKRRTAISPVLDHGFAVFAWSIRDPGNFGTIIRSVEATGGHFIACSPDCVDAYSPKVIRASMGSVFRVPVFTVADPDKYLKDQQKKGIGLCGMVPRDGTNIFESTLPEPAMIILGSETTGIPDTIDLNFKLSIPMSGSVESLNVGVAASIAFYHFMTTLMANKL